MILIKYLINEKEYEYYTELTDDSKITDEIMEKHNITENNLYYVTWYRN
jgi:hypothetical protein